MVACSSSRDAANDQGLSGSGLTGAWCAKIQFKQGVFESFKDLEFLYVFNAGGTMTESSNYDGAPPVPPAYGIWRAVGPGQYEASYKYYNTRPPAKAEDLLNGGGWMPAGYGIFTERITLAHDGQSFDSTISFDLYDQSGKRIEHGSQATGHGVRMRF
jgi:hypothetical protein